MSSSLVLPEIIQGGMGIGVSGWRLARAVSSHGQLGVVSGTAVESLLVRRLQDGDPGGDTRRALAHSPSPMSRPTRCGGISFPGGRPAGTRTACSPCTGWGHRGRANA